MKGKDLKKIYREDGRIEWVCNHGVGHPWGTSKDKWESWMGIHGCDGCCSHWHEEDIGI